MLIEPFYGLIPQSRELLKCEDYKVANLVMIQLPDFLFRFYNTAHRHDPSTMSATSPQLNPTEHGPLSNIAGYIVSKLHQTKRKKKGNCSEEIRALLQAMKSTESPSKFISARTRAGLISPCDDLIRILEITELSFREEVNKSKLTVRNVFATTECICNSVQDSHVVKLL